MSCCFDRPQHRRTFSLLFFEHTSIDDFPTAVPSVSIALYSDLSIDFILLFLTTEMVRKNLSVFGAKMCQFRSLIYLLIDLSADPFRHEPTFVHPEHLSPQAFNFPLQTIKSLLFLRPASGHLVLCFDFDDAADNTGENNAAIDLIFKVDGEIGNLVVFVEPCP